MKTFFFIRIVITINIVIQVLTNIFIVEGVLSIVSIRFQT